MRSNSEVSPDSANPRAGLAAAARKIKNNTRIPKETGYSQEGPSMDVSPDPPRHRGPLTLAIDVGGTRLKAGLLDQDGTMVAGPNRINTPLHPAPQAVVDALVGLATPLGEFDRISVGFPGVVRLGQVLTAPNLGTPEWHHFPLAASLTDKLGKPVRMLNDAEVQGLGVVAGKGLECVITLGTGMGFSLFQNGRPAPHLELSQHPIHKGKTYDQFIGVAAFKEVGRARWNRRLRRVLACINTLVGFDTLYIGGGNAKQVDIELAANIQIVSNQAGITGGVRLWDKALDSVFAAGA
jgi:polyphosphate glucokinase